MMMECGSCIENIPLEMEAQVGYIFLQEPGSILRHCQSGMILWIDNPLSRFYYNSMISICLRGDVVVGIFVAGLSANIQT